MFLVIINHRRPCIDVRNQIKGTKLEKHVYSILAGVGGTYCRRESMTVVEGMKVGDASKDMSLSNFDVMPC